MALSQYLVFIQARMSSTRFPGKVLAPLCGKPVIMHLIERVYRVTPMQNIIVLTSQDATDDPLAEYLTDHGIRLFRGDLHYPFVRFRQALNAYPCEWFCRLSADSPFFDDRILSMMLPFCDHHRFDLVTNVYPRTFAKGLSAELINAKSFSAIEPNALTQNELEHVTTFFYHHADQYRIKNIYHDSTQGFHPDACVVDTEDDLARLQLHLSGSRA